MRFIDGLKDLFKKKTYSGIFITFLVLMVIFIINYTIIRGEIKFTGFVIFLMVAFTIFTFILLIFSFFIPVDKMNLIVIIIALLLTFPATILIQAFGLIITISSFFIYVNQFLTAFFAFKFCIDTSIQTDDYLAKKKASKVTRTMEFILFFLLTVGVFIISVRLISRISISIVQNSGRMFSLLFWISVVLFSLTLIRLILMKKFAAYISMFSFLTFLYMLYIFIDVWYGWYYQDNQAYDILSFIIDILLFLYIMGSIFERVDYIQDKLKIIRVDTIGLFVIIMKLVVQINKILQEINFRIPRDELAHQIAVQTFVLVWFFVIFTIIIGIYYIFKHKK